MISEAILNSCTLYIRHAGESTSTRGWVEAERVIYDHQWVFVESGQFIFRIGGERYDLSAGEWIIVPPNVKHVSILNANLGKRRWVHFDWQYSQDRSNAPLLTYMPHPIQSDHIVNTPEHIDATHLRGQLSSTIQVRRCHDIILKRMTDGGNPSPRGALVDLLEMLFLGDTSSAGPGPHHTLESIKHQLDSESLKPITEMTPLDALLSQHGQSYAHLCRQFKGYYGLSPHQYITSSRMERAKEALRRGEKAVNVAALVGYDSAAYFSKVFKQLHGMTPLQYADSL